MHLLAALAGSLLAALAVCYSPAFVAPRHRQRRLSVSPDGASPGEVYGSSPSSPLGKLDVLYKAGSAMGVLATAQLLGTSAARAEEQQIISRADVGLIDLNTSEPQVTSVCWMDLRIGDNIEAKRVEISLYGTVAPKAAANFKSLCTNELGYGYKGSDIFRVISTFSLQGGNIGQPLDAQPALRSRYGRAGLTEPNSNQPYGEPFDPDNYRILHSYREAGVISMMKDLTNKGKLDSRFFITFSPYASWADSKYEAFGRVSKGMDLISAIQIVPVEPPSNYPKSRIEIVDSGCY